MLMTLRLDYIIIFIFFDLMIFHQSYQQQPSDGQRRKRLDGLTTSLYSIGGKVGNALEVSLT